ncbi:MAG: hypothetical protein ACE5KX_08570, partial [Acidimicrobiia bacterium]
ELVDLDTLGGRNSMALGINDRGNIIVGWSEVAGRPRRTHAVLWTQREVVDLETLGGRNSEARDVNGLGQVVGVSDTARGRQHAFYAFGGVLVDLNNALVHPLSTQYVDRPVLFEANAINNDGWVVASGTVGDVTHGYVLVPVSPFDLYAPRYSYLDVGFVSGTYQQPPLDDVVGSDDDATEEAATELLLLLAGTGEPETASSAAGRHSLALGINERNQVVGASSRQAFIWDDSSVSRLDDLSYESQANAISLFGLIVGSTAGPDGLPTAAMWSLSMADHRWDLYPRTGWISAANDVYGMDVVGWAADNPEGNGASAMLFNSGNAFNLNDHTDIPLLPSFAPSLRLEEATAIDANGRIVGYARLTDGTTRAFLLNPTEDTTSD